LCVTAAFGTDDGDADLLALINAPEVSSRLRHSSH
jgi:hypothetical protein